jgi:hypothetical protein
MSEARREAIAILERRIAKRSQPPAFELPGILFGPQLAFVQDPSNFATGLCSRRAGKTVGMGAWLEDGPIKGCGPSLYLTLTRKSASARQMWHTLLDLNRKHRLGYDPNETELTLKRNGQACVFLVGLDNKSEIEKVRGTGWGRVVIDEAQSLPAFIEDLVENVLMPSLMDHNGQIRMIGTPAPVPVGYFHDATTNGEWSTHSWTVWENPHIPDENKRAMLAKVLKTRGITEDHPSIQREWYGRWALDADALVIKYDSAKNVWRELPRLTKYVIGVDLGFGDADAIAVIGFDERDPAAYLVEEHVIAKQTVTPLAVMLRGLVEKYQPQAMVMDTGGLGKKIAEEMRQRSGLPVKPAEKQDKYTHIELLNDSLRSARFLVPAGSRFGSDAMLLEWDQDASTPDRMRVSDRFHSDIIDAVLYAFREAQHWMHVPEVQKPAAGTPEAMESQAKTYWQELEERAEAEAAERALDNWEW